MRLHAGPGPRVPLPHPPPRSGRVPMATDCARPPGGEEAQRRGLRPAHGHEEVQRERFTRRVSMAGRPQAAPRARQPPDGATRQMALPTSSATSKAPRASKATPTGRPRALPSALRKPVSTSCGRPCGRPSWNATNTTL